MAFGGDNPESYYDEGLTAAMRGDYPLAIQYFKKAVQLDNQFLPAYQQMAKCHLRMGHAAKASELLRQVIAVNPGQMLPHIELGNALLEMGHIEEARSHFTHVLNQKPNQPRACLGLAQCSFEEGHWAAATELARNAVEHGGANFAALLLLGRAARLAGLGEESRDALHRADALMETTIESNPDAPEGYFLRGEVYFAREDWAKALENYRAADDRADPKTEYAAYGMHFNRLDILAKAGVCFQRLGRLEQAREVGRRIVEHNPDHKIGVALAALGGEESTT